MKRIEFYSHWTEPWKECMACALGPVFLNEGSIWHVGIGVFFAEVGIIIIRSERKEENRL